ncbi:pyridoxal-phosphate dependent enzyme [Pseudomonas sp. NPDC088322]
MPLHIHTPLIESRPMSLAAGRSIWLKLDALQPCGSFKLRGVGHACEQHHARGARHFVSSSGGNAGLAVAYAGRSLGVPVTVVVPETTSERARELLRLEDAKVIVHGGSWQEANQLAQTLVGANDAFIHPFDDPLLWTGHASLIDEVAAADCKPDALILSVGGGGLLSGVVEGLKRNGWDDVPVLAVETTGAASFHAAVEAGHTVELPALSSIATSLGAKRVAEQALECARSHPVESHLVTDREALQACERFLADHRLLVEPACGAALALAYKAEALGNYRKVLVVVCGGATATLEQIQL